MQTPPWLRFSKQHMTAFFLDYHLPGKNGLQLTQEIRGQGIEVPVIVMTSQGDEPTAVELMKAGASDYLPKRKLSSEVLARLIYSAIRMHQAEALVESFNQHIIEKNILLRRQNQELARQQRYIYQQKSEVTGGVAPKVGVFGDNISRTENPAKCCNRLFPNFVEQFKGNDAHTQAARYAWENFIERSVTARTH